MLKLFITPSAIVFEDMTDELFQQLTDKYNIDFTQDEDEYKVEAPQENLYKLILKLSYDFDIEIS